MTHPISSAITLDFSGLRCPLPVLQTKKALAKRATGDMMTLICTDPSAPADFSRFCAQTGHLLVSHWQNAGKFFFLLQKR